MFIEDKSNETLKFAPGTLPFHKLDKICEDDEVVLKFMAPSKAGRHEYVVWCRSDSVYGCDASVELEVEVVNGDEEPGVVQEDDGEPSLRRRLKLD